MHAIDKAMHKQKATMKRGEKEALSLKRRRQLKNIMTFVTVITLCVAFVTSVYLWQSGKVTDWVFAAEGKMEDGLVNAGVTVEDVQLTGNFQTSIDDVLKKINIQEGTSLLAVDMEDVKSKTETLTWVKNATVTRRLPNTLIINLEEHEPSALWSVNNTLWLISNEGTLITDEGLEYFADLPMISGQGADQNLEKLVDAVSESRELFEFVETAKWIGERRWDLMLKNGVTIMMPENDLRDAWMKLVELNETEELLSRNILIVDLRLKDKTIVRLTPDEVLRRDLLSKTNGKGEEI